MLWHAYSTTGLVVLQEQLHTERHATYFIVSLGETLVLGECREMTGIEQHVYGNVIAHIKM